MIDIEVDSNQSGINKAALVSAIMELGSDRARAESLKEIERESQSDY